MGNSKKKSTWSNRKDLLFLKKKGKYAVYLKAFMVWKKLLELGTKKFHGFILKFGLNQSLADPCVYFRHQRKGEIDEEFTVLIIYVDDGIIFSNNQQILTNILEHLVADGSSIPYPFLCLYPEARM